MSKEKKEFIIHEQSTKKYKTRDLNKFKELIKEYEAEDKDAGRDAITVRDLAELANESYEMFRKILNTGKTTAKRDYIIMIGILLRMDSDTICDLLSYYGMPVLNPKDDRDSELCAIADEGSDAENPNDRFSMFQINEKLQASGFQALELKSRAKNEFTDTKYRYDIISQKAYTTGDYMMGSPFALIATRYDFNNYCFMAKMYIRDKISGQTFVLKADDKGYFSREVNPWSEDESPFTLYDSLENTGEYIEYFKVMLRGIRNEKSRVEVILNDTKNYGERIGAGIMDRKFHVFAESYNYDIPEREEYYLMQYIDGVYKLFVFNESVFMRMYLTKKEYEQHYRVKEIKPVEFYKSEEEIENRISEKECAWEEEVLFRSRQRYYKKLKQSVSACFQDILAGRQHVKKADWMFDEEIAYVCRYFNVEKEYDCYKNEIGMYFPGRDEHQFTFNWGSVNLSFENLCRAFELGFETIEDICLVMYDTGSIESILYMGPN